MVKKVKSKFHTIIYGWNLQFDYVEKKLTAEEIKSLLPTLKDNFPVIIINGIPIPSNVSFTIKTKER
jgi:hypothetical protein